MLYSRKNQLLHLACYTLLIICTPFLTQGFDTVTPDLQYDKNIEASGLRGVPLKTQQMNMILPSRSIDSEKRESKISVDGPYHLSTQGREWGPHAHLLGVNIDDNVWVSSCVGGVGHDYFYVCAKQGPNNITVFQTQDGINWEYVTLDYGQEVNYPDIDTGAGYIYISCSFKADGHPGMVRSTYINSIESWGPLLYWDTYSDVRSTSVGAPTVGCVCMGFHLFGDADIRYFHTIDYPGFVMETVAYNPDASTQRNVEIDAGFYSLTRYVYSVNEYFDTALHEYQGRAVVYEMGASSMTMVVADKVSWSDTSSSQNLTIHGDSDKFTVAYQYFDSSSHNIYARTYRNCGSFKLSIGHVAETTASDMYPRVYHDPSSNWMYFVYLKLAGGSDVYTSIADSDYSWTTVNEKILDSEDSIHLFRGVCTLHTGTNGGQRQIVAWVDDRDEYDNVYYNLEMLPDEGCPGEEIDISTWTPESGDSITINSSLNQASDDIYEITEISCWSGDSSRENVYRFTPPEDMCIQIDLIGSDFDTKMAIVSPCPDGSNTCMYSDDYNEENAGFACTEFHGGTTYSIIVTGDNEIGAYSLNLDECTDLSCTELGCTVTMPSHKFEPGDTCYCDVTVCNPHAETYTDVPVFAILDVYSSYFFAPGFSDYDYFTETVPPGETIIPVLQSFAWPPGAGTASGIVWYAAMTNQAISELFGQIGMFEFGWHE
jgi:hypothetical protein